MSRRDERRQSGPDPAGRRARSCSPPLLTTVEAALSSFSRARALELAHEQRPGAVRLLRLLDDAAHNLNAVLVLRLLTETSAVVLATAMVLDLLGPDQWTSVLAAIGLMFVVLFVVVGVGPRTIGRQRSGVDLAGDAPAPSSPSAGCSARCRGC